MQLKMWLLITRVGRTLTFSSTLQSLHICTHQSKDYFVSYVCVDINKHIYEVHSEVMLIWFILKIYVLIMSLNSELKSRKVLQRGTVCAIGTCKNVNSVTKANEATKHIMYHRFPRDAQLRKAWVLKTGRIMMNSIQILHEFVPSTSEKMKILKRMKELRYRKNNEQTKR